jgi:gluconate 5-dehydrogenase
MSVRKLFDLTGRVALITGGSRGLGLQIAEALAEQGASLVLIARKAEQLAEAKAHLSPYGVAVHTIAHNLSHVGSIPELVTGLLEQTERIDILVNNAGATWGAAAEGYPAEAWDKVITLNLTALFSLTQAVARQSMIPRQTGAIVNVASVAGLQGNHPQMMGTVAYNTSKGGLIALTRALAAEWAKYGIRVNALAPGFFPTKMTTGTLEKAQRAIEAATPLGRVGGPEDLKGAALLLASDASAFITGQVIVVDGGVSVI